jgi:hypothetical protein
MTFRIYQGSLLPSIADTIRVGGLPVNLTGATVAFSMRPEDAATLALDHVAAVIVSAAAGTVQLDWPAGSTSIDPGAYRAWWTVTDENGVQDSPEFDVEVEAHGPVASSDLCTVEDVRRHLEWGPDDRRDRDPRIAELIPLATWELERYAGRWFTPRPQATRKMRFERHHAALPGDLRADKTHEVVLNGSTLGDEVDYQLHPIDAPDGSYRSITFFPYAGRGNPHFGHIDPGYYRGLIVEVSGEWGMPTAPPGARRACILTVASWLDRGAPRDFAVTVDDPRGGQPESTGTYAIPSAARRALGSLVRWVAD